MRKEVPNFIDVKDKVFGPLTFDQFLYLLGGAGMIYLAVRFVPIFPLKILVIAIAGGLSMAMAFMKYNGRPFVYAFQAFVMYILKPKLYLYKPRMTKNKELFVKRAEESLHRELLSEAPVKGLDEDRLRVILKGLDAKND